MGKALILDADFSAVALDTVTIVSEPIPCTGISLSQSSVTITDFDPVTLTATVTPSDTTDAVTWSCSDTSVCTVTNGVITPIKSGTATITATCGSQTATCDVTLNIVIDVDAGLTFGYVATAQGEGVNYAENAIGGATYFTEGNKHAFNSNGINAYPFLIPNGCTELRVTVPNQKYKVTVQWTDDTQNSSQGTQMILRVGGDSNYYTSSVPNGDRVLTPPEGANSCFITIYPRDNSTMTADDLAQVTVKAVF